MNNMGICFGMDSFDNEYCISCELTQSGECLSFPQQSKTTTTKKKYRNKKWTTSCLASQCHTWKKNMVW
uniref:Uncharacterized protein n=1 Tax=Anguilla anguilla TaxID=7936 RepID=A0A0E9X4X2_ANGAN